MILHIKGNIDYIDTDGMLFISLANGLSFQVDSLLTKTIGEQIELWLYMVLKESEGKMDLKFYGFPERFLIDDFERLMSISGVGPKMAFSILKNIDKNKLIESIIKGEYETLKKLPGIGDKLAKRIVLELSRLYSKNDDILQKMQDNALSDSQNEVVTTLVQMGFDKVVILKCMKNIDPNLSKKDILREVLTMITTNVK
ncbi:MAG: Holliday junction branch migration protein RuvA [bacterium]